MPGLIALLGAASLAGPLVGCALLEPEPPAAVRVAAGPDPAETLVPEQRLVEAVERAERALAALARSVPPPDAVSAMPSADAVPEALMQPVTIDWTGPLPALAAELAHRAGYRFVEAGRPPARPLMVAIEAVERPLVAVLRDAGLRAGGIATLTVDAARQTVLLDWAVPVRGEDG